MIFYLNAKKFQGFTLIEIVVTIAIILIIIIPLTRLQVNVLSYGSYAQNTNYLQDEARRVLQKFSSEIRSANESSAGAYAISEATNTSIIFFRDADQDGLAERIRYYQEGTTLKKGIIVPSGNPPIYATANEKISTIVHGVYNSVSEPIFQYYDRSYNGQTAPLSSPINLLSVRLVKINLIIGTGDDKQARMTVTTQVSLRNIKDNL